MDSQSRGAAATITRSPEPRVPPPAGRGVAMQIVFRRFPKEPPRFVAAGELHLRPAGPNAAPRMTALALEKGEAGFVRGEGPVQMLVIQAVPTLDDMVAALV